MDKDLLVMGVIVAGLVISIVGLIIADKTMRWPYGSRW
jgi:hypothetical protein